MTTEPKRYPCTHCGDAGAGVACLACLAQGGDVVSSCLYHLAQHRDEKHHGEGVPVCENTVSLVTWWREEWRRGSTAWRASSDDLLERARLERTPTDGDGARNSRAGDHPAPSIIAAAAVARETAAGRAGPVGSNPAAAGASSPPPANDPIAADGGSR